MAGGDRQHPAGRGLGGDHPERLREGARHDQRLGAGQQLGDLVVLEPADELDRAGGAPRRPPRSRPADRRGTRRGSAAAPPPRPRGPRPSRGDLARVVEIAAVERRQAAGAARPRTRRSPAICSRASGCSPWTSGQAASSRSTPLETISLPTKTTRSGGVGAARRGGAARRRRQPPLAQVPARARVTGSPRPKAAPCRPRAGRAASSLEPETSGERRPERLGRVARADEDAPRPLPCPRGVGQEARVRLDRVLERRAVDLGGEGARPARARIAGPMTRWLASAASMPPPRRRPRGRRRRWPRGSARARRRSSSGKVLTSNPS